MHEKTKDIALAGKEIQLFFFYLLKSYFRAKIERIYCFFFSCRDNGGRYDLFRYL